MEEIEEKNLRRRRRCRAIRYQSSRTKGNRLNLPILSASFELSAIESQGDSASVPGPDDDFLLATDGALAAGSHQFGRDRLAIGGDRDPGFFARLDYD